MKIHYHGLTRLEKFEFFVFGKKKSVLWSLKPSIRVYLVPEQGLNLAPFYEITSLLNPENLSFGPKTKLKKIKLICMTLPR